MAGFRERMSEVLDHIAQEHEHTAKRLGQQLAPVVSEELRLVGKAAERRRGEIPGGAEAFTESQLDELARAVQAEIVEPLHARVRDLTAQVAQLREDARHLEQRCEALVAQGATALGGPPPPGGLLTAERPETEEHQAEELEKVFREGRTEEALVRAMKLQKSAKRVDFLGKLLGQVEDPEQWLTPEDGPSPLSMRVKMFLMLALGSQLESGGMGAEEQACCVSWIHELWLCFDWEHESVTSTAPSLCKQLGEVLERADKAFPAGTAASKTLRQLRRNVQSVTSILARG